MPHIKTGDIRPGQTPTEKPQERLQDPAAETERLDREDLVKRAAETARAARERPTH